MFNTIYISNLSEDVWPFISAISGSGNRSYEIQENTKLSDRDIFSFAGYKNTIVVLPSSVDASFIDYFKSVTGNSHLKLLTPKAHTGEICNDILHDKTLFRYLEEEIRKAKKMNIISYNVSPQFMRLLEKFRKLDLNVQSDEAPNQHAAWTVDFYGSKSGIRQLIAQLSLNNSVVNMPDGLITFGIENAAKMATHFYLKNKGVVIKTNKGHSGAGVLVYGPHDLPSDYEKCKKHISVALGKHNYWSKFAIIMEKYIEPQYAIGGGYPNAEYQISKTGQIKLLYYCSMRVAKRREFKGIEIHKSVLSDKVAADIIHAGFAIGEKIKSAGYAGYFDVDCIAAKDGRIYISECNMRRTGGTHVYHLARHLFGKDFMSGTYTLSNNLHPLKRKGISTFARLHACLSSILYHNNTKEGLVIISASLLSQNKFGYVIFGKTKKRAYAIEKQMDKLLGY